jgi:O-antigen ligase
MTTHRVLRIAGVVLGLLLALYFLRFSVGRFADVTFLGGLLFLEVLIACVWKYEERFFLLTIIAFVWAGVGIPLHGAWTAGRWAVLAAGAVVGFIVWIRKSHAQFSTFHLIALFCAGSAFVSATTSPLPQMAALKALSLFLLFLYGSGGARAAMFGREERFFKGLLWGGEVAVYGTALAYFGLSYRFWGNPNALGTAMSIGAFPILFWGWVTSEPGPARWRRLAALLLCTYLVFFSLERAGMAAIVLVTLAFCFCLRQYKVLMKGAMLAFGVVAVAGMVNPVALNESAISLRDAVLYKGHKEVGVLGSRRSPWDKTVSNIKEHPWFGTGYGTSLSGEDTVVGFRTTASTADTSREHGSSYMAIVEWVGLLGVLPFVVLVGLNAFHVLKVGLWLRRTGHASHYSVPLAMVLLAGFIHANFEDWMFAVGSYAAIYFWSLSFILLDLLPPHAVSVPLQENTTGHWPFSAEIAGSRQ